MNTLRITPSTTAGVFSSALLVATQLFVVVGCGGDDTPPTPSPTDGTAATLPGTATSDQTSAPANPDPGKTTTGGGDAAAPPPATTTTTTACVQKGAKANDKGVGAYCDKSTKCEIGFICTGDFGAPEGATFCTTICLSDDDCGTGAHCFTEQRGQGCVLDVCQDK